jgi:VWFA-related protein
MPRLLTLIALGAVALSAFAPAASSQQKPGNKDFTIKVDVDLVQLPVTVVDKDGRGVTGLQQEHFEVFEDKVRQEITLFKHEDIPLSVGLVIDNSGSMRSKRDRVHSSALTFVRESNPDDQTFVVAFDEDAYIEQEFTGSMGDLVDALENLDPRLGTALYDAIWASLDYVQKGVLEKKVLLVISDGEDADSKTTYDKLLAYVRKTRDIPIYAIGLLEENDQRSGGLFGRNRPSKKAKDALTEIAALTGGKAYFPKTADEVEEICARIARDLRNQYTVGYSPSNTKLDGTYRTIRVEIKPPRNLGKLTHHTRQGYTAPGGPDAEGGPQ